MIKTKIAQLEAINKILEYKLHTIKTYCQNNMIGLDSILNEKANQILNVISRQEHISHDWTLPEPLVEKVNNKEN